MNGRYFSMFTGVGGFELGIERARDRLFNQQLGGRHTPMIIDLYNKKEHTDRSPTLTEPHHNTLRVREGLKIRRLTPTECLRLQGFPDNWFDGINLSDTQKYKMMGNAVTTNVIKAITNKLIK